MSLLGRDSRSRRPLSSKPDPKRPRPNGGGGGSRGERDVGGLRAAGGTGRSYDEGIDIYHVKNITFESEEDFRAAVCAAGVGFLEARMFGKAEFWHGEYKRDGFVTIFGKDEVSGRNMRALAGSDFGPPGKLLKLYVEPVMRTESGQFSICAVIDHRKNSLPRGTAIVARYFAPGSFTSARRHDQQRNSLFFLDMATVRDFCDVLTASLPVFEAIRPAVPGKARRPSLEAGSVGPNLAEACFRDGPGDAESSLSGAEARSRDCDGEGDDHTLDFTPPLPKDFIDPAGKPPLCLWDCRPGDRVKGSPWARLDRLEDGPDLELQRGEVLSLAVEKPDRSPVQPNFEVGPTMDFPIEVETTMDFRACGLVAVKTEDVGIEPPVVPAERFTDPTQRSSREFLPPGMMLTPKREEWAVPASLRSPGRGECIIPAVQATDIRLKRDRETYASLMLGLGSLCENSLRWNRTFLVSNLPFLDWPPGGNERALKEDHLSQMIATKFDVGVAGVKLLDFRGGIAVVGVESEKDASVLNDPSNAEFDLGIGAGCRRVRLARIRDFMRFIPCGKGFRPIPRSQVDDLVLLSANDMSKAEVLSYSEDGTFVIRGDLYNLLAVLAMSGRSVSSGYKYTHQFDWKHYRNIENAPAPAVPLSTPRGHRGVGYRVDDSQKKKKFSQRLLVKNVRCTAGLLVSELKRISGLIGWIDTEPCPERHCFLLVVYSQNSFDSLLRQNGAELFTAKGSRVDSFRIELIPYGNDTSDETNIRDPLSPGLQHGA